MDINIYDFNDYIFTLQSEIVGLATGMCKTNSLICSCAGSKI